MSVESAKAFLQSKGLDKQMIILNETTATVEDAANAIGVSCDEIAKTLSFLVGETPVLIVAAGTVRIDNAKFKQQFATKAKMIHPEDVERLIGHAPGGVCPFGVKDGVEVYFDKSLRKFDYVYPAAGADRAVLKISVGDLENAVDPKDWVDVSKSAESNT